MAARPSVIARRKNRGGRGGVRGGYRGRGGYVRGSPLVEKVGPTTRVRRGPYSWGHTRVRRDVAKVGIWVYSNGDGAGKVGWMG